MVLDGEVRSSWWDDVHLLVIPGGIDDPLWRDNHGCVMNNSKQHVLGNIMLHIFGKIRCS